MMNSKPFRLTVMGKAMVFVGLAALAVASIHVFAPGAVERLLPHARTQRSQIPVIPGSVPLLGQGDCAGVAPVKVELWAWNSQLGLMAANGGKVSTPDSAMCAHGVKLELVRQDDGTKMREDLVTFAQALHGGNPQPTVGTHFVAIMGDGSATFLAELNNVLGKLGPSYRGKVVGSSGYSWGEDKFMGPTAWKENPSSSRGGLVAGVVRDGDWNLAQKWLAENRLCNNPDEKTYDPECLNWVNTPGYVEAASAYIAGVCEDRKVVSHGALTGKTQHVCVQGVVTWTPGDVAVAQKKGGLVSIVSTREYRGQMPQVLIGIDGWMEKNRAQVEGMLAAMFEGGEAVKTDERALLKAAQVSAQVYGEEDASYWARYFGGTEETDRKGLRVQLGGSRVNNLADNLYLFGVKEFAPESANLFAATYTVFGNVVKAQYPELLPSFPPVAEILDTSYLVDLARRGSTQSSAPADLVSFREGGRVKQVVSDGSWAIAFDSGKATFTKGGQRTLDELFDQLLVAGGTLVEIHGHTDSQGDAKANQALSEARAFAVKQYLEKRSPAYFPAGRVRVFAHGQDNPLAPNSTPEGRALNRRVQVVLGTSS